MHNVANPDRLVDRLFPGRYLPFVLVWVLFAAISMRLHPHAIGNLGKPGIFYSGLLSGLAAASIVAVFFTKRAPQFDIPGQLFLFTAFTICRAVTVSPLIEHFAVINGMAALMIAAMFRGPYSLPLGPSLVFISLLLQTDGVPLYVALIFPALIVFCFFLLFAPKGKPALPPLASLAAAAIYLTRLSWDTQYRSVAVFIIGLCLSLAGAIYLYRKLISYSAKNTNIHIAEDLLIYVLLLASLRLTEAFSPLQYYTALAGFFFISSMCYSFFDRRPEFVASASVAIFALVPVLETQFSGNLSSSETGVKILAYCMLGSSAAIYSQLYKARVPNHLGKGMLIYASILLLVEIAAQDGAKHLVTLERVALAISLGVSVLVLGLVIGHIDLHRPNERLWNGIFSPRLLASARRLQRNASKHARSIPAVGFFISLLATSLAMLRQAFGGRKSLSLSHFSQIVLVALAVPTFAICARRALELAFLFDKYSPAALLATFGLSKGYPAPLLIFGAFVVAIMLFAAGEVIRVAYLRLCALLVPLAFMIYWAFSYSANLDIPIAALCSMFVIAHAFVKSRDADKPNLSNRVGVKYHGTFRTLSIVAGSLVLWVIFFVVLTHTLTVIDSQRPIAAKIVR